MTNRIELSISRRFPFAEAHEFGAVGAYERLVGRANSLSTRPLRPSEGLPIWTRRRRMQRALSISREISRS
jgi:hypothetical protein